MSTLDEFIGHQFRKISLPAFLSVAFFVLALLGCGTDSPNDESPPVSIPELELHETHASPASLSLSSIREVEIDSRGRVFLVDGFQGGVTLLSPALELLQMIGRAGEGPGEFRVRLIRILAGDSLAVYDPNLDRMTVFDPFTISVIRTARPSAEYGGFPPTWYWSMGERRSVAIARKAFYAGEGSEQDVDRLNDVLVADHGVVDTILTVPSEEFLVWRSGGALSVSGHPFGREPIIRALDSRRLVYAHTAEARFWIVGMTGDTLASGQIPVAPIDVSRSDLEAAAGELNDDMRGVLLNGAPYRWPVIRGLTVEGGGNPRVWIGVRGSSDSDFWPVHVFDSTGRHAAVSELPAGQELRAVRDGIVVATSTDTVGVPRVHRYRISRGG